MLERLYDRIEGYPPLRRYKVNDDKRELRVRREKAYTGIRTEDTGCTSGPLWKDGVWLEARDGKVGDLEPWMVEWLRDGRIPSVPEYDDEGRFISVNTRIANAISRILKEAEDGE